MDFDDVELQPIKDGIAEGMNKEADAIAQDEQKIRDHFQPLGRIVPDNEQEKLNSITASSREHIKHLRDTADLLKHGAVRNNA